MWRIVQTFNCLLISVINSQGSNEACAGVGEARGPKEIPFTSRVTTKWLNVILDLNGVLCVSEDKRYHPIQNRVIETNDRYLDLVCVTIGIKRVTLRPYYKRFLRELSAIANVSIWSSMKRSTVLAIADYMFSGIEAPLYVLGQEQCNVLMF